MDAVKVEKDVDVTSQEDSVDIKTEEVYIPSTYSAKKNDPEVSLFSPLQMSFVMMHHVFIWPSLRSCCETGTEPQRFRMRSK